MPAIICPLKEYERTHFQLVVSICPQAGDDRFSRTGRIGRVSATMDHRCWQSVWRMLRNTRIQATIQKLLIPITIIKKLKFCSHTHAGALSTSVPSIHYAPGGINVVPGVKKLLSHIYRIMKGHDLENLHVLQFRAISDDRLILKLNFWQFRGKLRK